MVDRRALIIGSWLPGREKPSSQKVLSITKRWKAVFKDNRFGFHSLKSKRSTPSILTNVTFADFSREFDGVAQITSETEFLFYFVGHSVSYGENDIKLILSVGKDGQECTISLSSVLQTIREQVGVKKLILILDTCHAGRTSEVLQNWNGSIFAMFSAGEKYAFDAAFSEGLLRALEQPFRNKDPRIDRSIGGLTYKRLFEVAQERAKRENPEQEPKYIGGYGDTILLPAPILVTDGYNQFALERTIYGRVYRVLELIHEKKPTFDALNNAIRKDAAFLLERAESDRNRYISSERLGDYLDFLRKAEWIVQPKGRFELTAKGLVAIDRSKFNKCLLLAIEDKIFTNGITFDFVDEIVRRLLKDMIPPTPVQIKGRAAMNGKNIILDNATRVAIQLLPSTGRFLKGAADAIYPSA